MIKKILHHWVALSPLTRGLWLAVLFSGVLLNIVLIQLSNYTSAAHYAGYYLSKVGLNHFAGDSWGPMTKAITYAHQFPNNSIYQALFFDGGVKFQYPPSSLLILEATPLTPQFLNMISWLVVLFVAITSALLFRRSANSLANPNWHIRSKVDSVVSFGAIILLTLLFYPLTKSFFLGQIQTWLTLLGALSLLAWSYDRRGIAGVLLGLACLIKPQWAVIVLWGALRKQWSMTVAALFTIAIFTALSVWLYGFHQYLDYLKVLSFLSQHGEGFYPNQSVNGLMNRMLFLGNNSEWRGDGFPPYNAAVYGVTLFTSVLIIGAVLLWRRGQASVLELALVLVSATVASPIAWEHHYGILLPVFAYITPIVIAQRVLGKWTVAYLMLAFVLASQNLELLNNLASTHLNFLQSYLFFAGLMMLLLLYRASFLAKKI